MDLYEFEGKKILKEGGLDVPKNVLVAGLPEARKVLRQFGVKAVLKSQVLTGGRGKAGGVQITNEENLEKAWKRIKKYQKTQDSALGKILVEEVLDIDKEYYLAITLDQATKNFVVMFSDVGGVDIEDLDRNKILTIPLRSSGDIEGFEELTPILDKLKRVFTEYDLTLLEINPLVLTAGGKLVLADAKIIVDDSALFRQQEKLVDVLSARQIATREDEFVYVELSGDTAVLGNGAGLTMATLDFVKERGYEPACFLDIGGGASAKRMKLALAKVFSSNNVERLLINIFAGITKADEVALGLVKFIEDKPDLRERIQAKISGTNSETAISILKKNKIKLLKDLNEYS